MDDFDGPAGLTFNRGLIADPTAFARDANAASWLFLCGEEFAALYAGLRAGATPAQVLSRAEADSAPFCDSEDLKAWVVQGLAELT